MEAATVEAALDTLRPGLDSDGFELLVGSIQDGRVKVVLRAKPDACLDCLVPDDLLMLMIEGAIRERDDSVSAVELAREGFDAATPHS